MKGFLTTKEAAERLGVSTARIRQLILNKTLPAEKVGRDNFIRESDLSKVTIHGKPGRPAKEKQ